MHSIRSLALVGLLKNVDHARPVQVSCLRTSWRLPAVQCVDRLQTDGFRDQSVVRTAPRLPANLTCCRADCRTSAAKQGECRERRPRADPAAVGVGADDHRRGHPPDANTVMQARRHLLGMNTLVQVVGQLTGLVYAS